MSSLDDQVLETMNVAPKLKIRQRADSRIVEQLLQQVRAAEAHYRALFVSFDDGVLVADGESRYVDANPAATTLLGYSRDELLEMQVADVVEAGLDWTAAEYERFRQEGHWRGELALRHKDGRSVSVDAYASVVNLPNEQVYVSILRDTTVRRQAERDREESNRFRDDVIATVAHDLGNPLTAIKASTQLLRRQSARATLALPPQVGVCLDRIEQSVSQMQATLDELSDLAYVHTGLHPQLVSHPTDLVALARRLVEQHQHAADSHSLEFRAEVTKLVGSWDPGRLERVLANLLVNAIKYSPAGGTITVAIRREANADQYWAVVEVRDHGIGIPAADLPRIFDLRRRGSNVPPAIRGQGVGLASARQTVELHRGTLVVESQEGVGSTFIVRLPLV